MSFVADAHRPLPSQPPPSVLREVYDAFEWTGRLAERGIEVDFASDPDGRLEISLRQGHSRRFLRPSEVYDLLDGSSS